MSKYVPAITSRGVEEVLPLSQSDLAALEYLAAFICQDHGHQPSVHVGYCEPCLQFATRIFAFQEEG